MDGIHTEIMNVDDKVGNRKDFDSYVLTILELLRVSLLIYLNYLICSIQI
jgi:hypothetical protein